MELPWVRALRPSPGDTRVIGYCAVFKVREEATRPQEAEERVLASRRRRAGLSKLNSMRPPRQSFRTPCGPPSPVDIPSGRPQLVRTAELDELRRRLFGRPAPSGERAP